MILFWTSINTQYDDRYFQVIYHQLKKNTYLLNPQGLLSQTRQFTGCSKPSSGYFLSILIYWSFVECFSSPDLSPDWDGANPLTASWKKSKTITLWELLNLKCIYFSSKNSFIITLHRKTSSQNHEDLCLLFSLQSFCWKSQRYPDYSFSVCNLFFFMRALKTSFIKVLKYQNVGPHADHFLFIILVS